MSADEEMKILLWNGLEIADQLGAKLTHTKEGAAKIAMDLGVYAENFGWDDNADGTISFVRKELA